MRKNSKNLLGIFLFLMLALVMGDGILPAADTAGSATQEKAPVEKEKKEKKSEKEKSKKTSKEELPELHYEVMVTATRTKRETFETPQPVSVVNRKKIEEIAPNNVTELLTELPGVDVNSVGANQSRPIIRGFRGQRILLMEDGIRMNNSRRQQDFGEIPALVDVSEVDRVEVVRGPASVLYGSDAIGGVINIITKFPQYDLEGTEIHGNIGYRHGSADNQGKGIANINGHVGRLNFMISGNYRKAGNYMAPAGTFGDIELTEDTTVKDTGVEDHGINFQLNYNISMKTQVSFKYEYYNSKDAGFGFIEPEIYNPDSARIQIQYPMQKVNKYTFKYENRELAFVLADHFSLTVYHLNNERELSMNIYVKINSPIFPPGAAVEQVTENFTDVETLGFRLELNKGAKNHTFTYGIDFFQDNTVNTDYSMSQMLGFGFPMVEEDFTPQVPNARYRSVGAFIQDEISLFSRTSLILGLRYQNVNAKTKETAGLEGLPTENSTDQTVVGSANLIYGITDHLRLVFFGRPRIPFAQPDRTFL
jgi:hemoglobin/transferrin/lactoferrin receptor protein